MKTTNKSLIKKALEINKKPILSSKKRQTISGNITERLFHSEQENGCQRKMQQEVHAF
jgi:NRPS condensation-like uncharacterized protein